MVEVEIQSTENISKLLIHGTYNYSSLEVFLSGCSRLSKNHEGHYPKYEEDNILQKTERFRPVILWYGDIREINMISILGKYLYIQRGYI